MKRATLLAKLEAFERAFEKQRLPILAVTIIMALEIIALPGAVWQTGDIATKLVTNMLQEVGQAKVADDEARQLPPVTEPARLSPPRPEPSAPAFETTSEDDIPF